METILEQIPNRKNPREAVNSYGYMPRVHEVQSPCQWLQHCDNGKCPAFVRLNGNFYCAKRRTRT